MNYGKPWHDHTWWDTGVLGVQCHQLGVSETWILLETIMVFHITDEMSTERHALRSPTHPRHNVESHPNSLPVYFLEMRLKDVTNIFSQECWDAKDWLYSMESLPFQMWYIIQIPIYIYVSDKIGQLLIYFWCISVLSRVNQHTKTPRLSKDYFSKKNLEYQTFSEFLKASAPLQSLHAKTPEEDLEDDGGGLERQSRNPR